MEYEYPWYFEQNNILDAWAITQGDGVVVDLIDSCVDYSVEPLKGKNYQVDIPACNEKDNVKIIHGTAMAGLIVGSKATLALKDNEGEFIKIAGIAPDAFLKNLVGKINVPNVKQSLDEAKNEITKTVYNEPVLKNQKDRGERPQIILLNLSGGQSSEKTGLKTEWNELIGNICKQEDNVLIMASVGNSANELTKENIYSKGVLPAVLKPKICQSKDIDPLIRVGATKIYDKSIQHPEIYSTALGTGSNYGKDYVDILAPGQGIPVIIPGNYGQIIGGTSEAAAIISGVVALLVSCHPYANVKDIREAILSFADKYQSLDEKVLDGNVLNIGKTVRNFCFNMQPKGEKTFLEHEEL